MVRLMRIAEILRRKGCEVATVTPGTTVRALLAVLAEHNIGAVVVSPGGGRISGIVSERDVVRGLHEYGAGLLDTPVSDIMTTPVRTCAPEDRVDGLRRIMTEHGSGTCRWCATTAWWASSASATWSRARSPNSPPSASCWSTTCRAATDGTHMSSTDPRSAESHRSGRIDTTTCGP